MDDLIWLMHWYASQCDGEWEHGDGVTLETLDNPGWYLKVNLVGTELEGRPFETQEHDLMSDVSWWTSKVEGGKFCAWCGPKDLPVILAIFRAWAEKPA